MSWEPTWEDLGATLGYFSMSKTSILEDNFFLANIAFFSRFLELAGAESLNGTPALIREASQYAGVLPLRG